MKDPTHNWTFLFVCFIIAMISLFATVNFANECRESGGTVARGVIWWVCIK